MTNHSKTSLSYKQHNISTNRTANQHKAKGPWGVEPYAYVYVEDKVPERKKKRKKEKRRQKENRGKEKKMKKD